MKEPHSKTGTTHLTKVPERWRQQRGAELQVWVGGAVLTIDKGGMRAIRGVIFGRGSHVC